MIFFSIYDEKITKLSRKTRFRRVASPGACGVHCERLAVLNDFQNSTSLSRNIYAYSVSFKSHFVLNSAIKALKFFFFGDSSNFSRRNLLQFHPMNCTSLKFSRLCIQRASNLLAIGRRMMLRMMRCGLSPATT